MRSTGRRAGFLAFGRVGVSAVTIAVGDASILVVDTELRSLISADLPAPSNRVPLGVMMATGAACAAPFYVPSPIGIWDDMVSLRSFTHLKSPVSVIA